MYRQDRYSDTEQDVSGQYIHKRSIKGTFRKWMATIHRNESGGIMYVKGAPEVLMPMCTATLQDGEVVVFDESKKNDAEKALNEMTGRALRVLGVAYKEYTSTILK